MNKRILKMVENYNKGKIVPRRDQVKKAIEENAFDYMIVKGYDEVYNVEPYKTDVTIENIPDYWLRGANMYCKVENNVLEVTLCYGYSYKTLYVNLDKEEEKEVETVQEVATVDNVDGIEVIFNEEKNGIEIKFASKDLATEEIRNALKSVGFKYYFKLNKWIARQNEKTISLVNELFLSSNKEEIKEVEIIETVEVQEEQKENNIIIHIEGEGVVEPITTNSIIEATENLNKRLLNEYNETCGGYSKTFITLTIDNENYKFRYDLDNKINLSTNIIKFMLDNEYKEYKYTLENIEKFKWINKEEYIKEYEKIFQVLENALEQNKEELIIKYNPYSVAVEKIQDNILYEIPASHNWILKDNRLIKNSYCNDIVVATGKAIKEFIKEFKYIDPFNLKPLKIDLQAFKEGLKKVDNGLVIPLIPTKEDRELLKIKMLDRLNSELTRV